MDYPHLSISQYFSVSSAKYNLGFDHNHSLDFVEIDLTNEMFLLRVSKLMS